VSQTSETTGELLGERRNGWSIEDDRTICHKSLRRLKGESERIAKHQKRQGGRKITQRGGYADVESGQTRQLSTGGGGRGRSGVKRREEAP